MVEWPSLTLNCLSNINFIFVRYLKNMLHIILSSIFEKHCKSDIDEQYQQTLNIVTILAITTTKKTEIEIKYFVSLEMRKYILKILFWS